MFKKKKKKKDIRQTSASEHEVQGGIGFFATSKVTLELLEKYCSSNVLFVRLCH